MLDAAAPGTVAIPFIYLQQKGAKNAPLKKIRFPKTYEGLLRTVDRMYGHKFPVRSLITEEGVVVQDLQDVIPGATILVSHLEAGQCEMAKPAPSPVTRKRQIMSKESFAFLFGNGEPKALMHEVGSDQESCGASSKQGRRISFERDSLQGSPSGVLDDYGQRRQSDRGSRASNSSRSEQGQRDGRPPRPPGVKPSVSYLAGSPHKSLLDMDDEDWNGQLHEAASMSRVPRARSRENRGSEQGSPGDSDSGREQKGRRSAASNRDDGRQSPRRGVKSSVSYLASSPNKNLLEMDEEELNSLKGAASMSRVPRAQGGSKSRAGSRAEQEGEESSHRSKKKARGHIKPSVSYIPTSPNKDMLDETGKKGTLRETVSMGGSPGQRQPLGKGWMDTDNQDSQTSGRSQTKKRKRVKRVKKSAKAKQDNGPDADVQEQDQEQQQNTELDESSDFEALEKSAALIDAFTQLLGKTSLERKVSKATDALPEFAESLNLLPTMEEQQMTMWQHRILEVAETQGLAQLEEDMFGINEMIGRARCLLVDHRFTHNCGFGHRYNIGIIGPRGSGKSTFLRIMTEEAILDLAATGEWKKTFVFILNCARICSHVENYIEFYEAIVAVTFQQLQWQKPHMGKHMKMLQKHFESVTRLKRPPVLPKAFAYNADTKEIAQKLQSITARLSSCWNSKTGLTNWIDNVVTFPDQIGKAFGFRKSLLILDHFDMIDVTLAGIESPFQESEEFVYVIDVVKFAARNANYIVACQDQQRFYTTLPSMTDDPRSNLNDYIHLVSMIGLIPDPHEDKQFYVDIRGFNVPLLLTTHHCGGIPAYLHIWDQLNELYERTQENDGEEDADELKLLMNVHMEQAIQILFRWTIDIEEDEFQVTDVRRKSKKSQEKSV